MDPGFRPREPEDVIEEMIYLNKTYAINHFCFSDELFMSSRRRVYDFCVAFIVKGISTWAKWDCSGRLNYADKDVLDIMKRAGCEYINYGIEALDDKVLANMKKGLTVSQIYRGIENTIKAGIKPGLNFIWGNIGDTRDTLFKALYFLLKYDTAVELRTIRPVTPYPGSELFETAVERGLIKDTADFYESKHLNSDLFACNFMDMPLKEAYENLRSANMTLLGNHYGKRLNMAYDQAAAFYRNKDVSFRGFRPV